MKERIISIFLLLLAGLTIWAITAKLPKKDYAEPAGDFSSTVQNGTADSGQTPVTSADQTTLSLPPIAEDVIRLHILADSDSERDQTIKLALRDILLPYLNAATLDAETKEEALAQLNSHCAFFTSLLNDALKQYQVDYTASVSIQRLYFPIRIYGSQTYLSEDAILFPPGFYDSVQVILGQGEGHNWWCLAWPSLCFIDSTYDYVPKDSDLYRLKIGTSPASSLEELFYGTLPTECQTGSAAQEDTSVYFAFKLLELFRSLFPRASFQ